MPPGTKLAPKPPAIKDWDTLSADEKRLFARQAEVFAAFAEYTDHEIGRMLKAFEEVGEADNTLVFYIAGDNGTSGEGGQNGMFNEYTYFNGVQEKVEDMLKRIDQWGGPETYPHMAAGWAVALNAPFGWMKQVPSDFGGTRNGMVVQLAEGHQGEGRDPLAVRPRDRRRSHDPAGDRPAGTEGGQRHEADPDGGNEPRCTRSTTRRRRSATRRSTSRLPAIARSTTTAGSRARFTARRGRPRRAIRCRTTSGSSTTSARTSAWPTTLPPSSRRSWPSCKALFMKEASKYHVLPIDDRVFERLDAKLVGRPDLMGGRTSLTLAEGMTGMMEAAFINVKNRSKTITAEVEVPQGGGNGTILAQGGRFGGWALYVKNGVPAYDYNFLGLQRTSVASSKPLAPGKHTIRYDFAYDGGGPAKGGMGTLLVDGEKVAEGRIAVTQPGIFSADETADVGIDLGTPVVEAIGSEAKSRFTGRIPKVTIDVK